ncbi:MAG: hypothetical protein ACTHLE_08305 [Agriterribacter sp.]
MFKQKPFEFVYKRRLVSGTYVIYEIAGETSYFIRTRQRNETIYAHKTADGKIVWRTMHGVTDEWIQEAGEGIERYIGTHWIVCVKH